MTALLVFVGKGAVLCDDSGKSLTANGKEFIIQYNIFIGYHGSLICPRSNRFCDYYLTETCMNGCTGRGTCTNGVCSCEDGWGAEDCSVPRMLEDCDRCKGDDSKTICFGDTCVAPSQRLELKSKVTLFSLEFYLIEFSTLF